MIELDIGIRKRIKKDYEFMFDSRLTDRWVGRRGQSTKTCMDLHVFDRRISTCVKDLSLPKDYTIIV